jgi:class 3 adenylate cyclase
MIIANIVLVILVFISFAIVWILARKNRRLVNVIKYHQKKIKEQKEKGGEQKKEDMISIERMIPKELFKVLKVKTISDISFENQEHAEMVNMYINSNDFSKMIHSMGAEEIFVFINRFLSEAIPKIDEMGGIIEGFQEAGMSVLFLEEPEKAVVAAVSICELLNQLGESDSRYNHFSIGLCYQNAMVGVVGHPKRWSLLTLPEEASGISGWLQSIADKYYAKILVTDSYLELIEDFKKKFNVRFLGYIYISDTDSMKKVYDVFDGDEKDVRNRKRQTKMVFEKGVNLFVEQNYQEARQHFIEVLKTDSFDKAAKEYVYLCELYLKEDADEKKEVYIEYYG